MTPKIRILIADDVSAFRALIKVVLQKEGLHELDEALAINHTVTLVNCNARVQLALALASLDKLFRVT